MNCVWKIITMQINIELNVLRYCHWIVYGDLGWFSISINILISTNNLLIDLKEWEWIVKLIYKPKHWCLIIPHLHLILIEAVLTLYLHS